MSYKFITINFYHLTCYSYENIELFYDDIEINLCKGFGRNLEALSNLFHGNCGVLKDATTTTRFHIHIKKSKLYESSNSFNDILFRIFFVCNV